MTQPATTTTTTPPSPATVSGTIIAIAALATFTAIGMFFASGAVADDPADPIAAGQAIADASNLLSTSAHVSIAANLLFAVGALMIALAPHDLIDHTEATRIEIPGLWATLMLGTLLILPFDLALPRGLIPLAQADPTAPVFTALYDTTNLVHSVGLFVFYVATSALFVHQAHTATTRGHRIGWRIMTGISALAVIVAIGLVIGKPPLVLVPTVFLTWLGLMWLGIRMATSARRAGTSGTQTRIESTT